GAVVASTDAAAVFFLIHAGGLRLRPRVGATLEVESGSNDPFAVLLTIILVEFLTIGDRSWQHVLAVFPFQAVLGTVVGILGGRAIVFVLNRLALAQGLHAPFVTTSALVIFGLASVLHASGFLAVYLAGLGVGNRPTRAHNTVVVFLDAVTWLAQIAAFGLAAPRGGPAAPGRGCLARAARREHLPGGGGGFHADVRGASRRRVRVPRAVSLFIAREGLHLVGRLARGGGHFPGLDSAADRLAQCPPLFRYRLRGGVEFAAHPGLDHRRGRAAAGSRAG